MDVVDVFNAMTLTHKIMVLVISSVIIMSFVFMFRAIKPKSKLKSELQQKSSEFPYHALEKSKVVEEKPSPEEGKESSRAEKPPVEIKYETDIVKPKQKIDNPDKSRLEATLVPGHPGVISYRRRRDIRLRPISRTQEPIKPPDKSWGICASCQKKNMELWRCDYCGLYYCRNCEDPKAHQCASAR